MKVAVLLLSLAAFAAGALAGESPANVSSHDRLLQLGCLDVTKAPYAADPTGKLDSTKAIQRARRHGRALRRLLAKRVFFSRRTPVGGV